jgi:5-methylcytosine-specific restriction endonuclease McrA
LKSKSMKTKTHQFRLPKYLRNKIRQAWLWSDVRRQAMKAATVSPGKARCGRCKKISKISIKVKVLKKVKQKRKIKMVEVTKNKKLVHVDHIDPFAPARGFRSLKELGPAIVRLFDLTNHQILCEACHSRKTKAENRLRRKLNIGED